VTVDYAKPQQEMIDALSLTGALTPEWDAVFRRVPRHTFVPTTLYLRGQEGWESIDREREPNRWLEAVYSDEVLVTRLDERGMPLSSSSMPSVMARFLDLLEVDDANSVLEIGTGTGYNAALLCERLGSANVTSIDIDGMCVDAAQTALSAAGYAPLLAVADGAAGYDPAAPYDRIIATCAVSRIPNAWIEQVRTGGVIVTPFLHPLAYSLGALRAQPDGSLQGMMHPDGATFMQLRSSVNAYPDDLLWNDLFDLANRAEGGETIVCDPPAEIRDAASVFHVFLRLRMSELEWFPLLGGLASRRDRSWVRLGDEDGIIRVSQGGPRRLWDLVLANHELWTRLDRPDMGRYGMTVTPDRRQVVWLDSPESEHRWEL
jgi:protein-L-isoaspartate(D-aspartate) O-methyltransferase